VKITKITQHPQYENGKAYYDIAVLETELVTFSGNIRSICLPSSKDFRVDKYNKVNHFLLWYTEEEKSLKLAAHLQKKLLLQLHINSKEHFLGRIWNFGPGFKL
jgi:hypothetical protein